MQSVGRTERQRVPAIEPVELSSCRLSISSVFFGPPELVSFAAPQSGHRLSWDLGRPKETKEVEKMWDGKSQTL